jgi:hypothetical protein
MPETVNLALCQQKNEKRTVKGLQFRYAQVEVVNREATTKEILVRYLKSYLVLEARSGES